MDKRENMKDSLQAMSLVNSKERIQGFGMFSYPDVCQTGGQEGGSSSTGWHSGESGQLAQMIGEFGASSGQSHIARWAGWPLPPR
jgi:hypothetical protein